MEFTTQEGDTDIKNILDNIYHFEKTEEEKSPKMSRWQVIQSSPQLFDLAQKIYQQHNLPLEVRYFFSEWIESQPWNNILEDNEEHVQFAHQLLVSLIADCEAKMNLMTGDLIIMRFKLEEAVRMFKELYTDNPMALVTSMKRVLADELNIIQQCQKNSDQTMAVETSTGDETSFQLNVALKKLNQKTAVTEGELKALQDKQESFIIQYQDSLKIQAQMQQLEAQVNNLQDLAKKKKQQQLTEQKALIDSRLTKMAQQLRDLRILIADHFNETVNELTDIQTKVLDQELINWKRKQQLAGNGAPFDGNLTLIQQWCETLAELIWNNRQQIKGVLMLRVQLPIDLPPDQVDLLPTLSETITSLLSTLVTSTFIVETQPPQVMKKDTKFTASVRLLVGGKLNVHMNPPQVKATIISEHQAKTLQQSDVKMKDASCGEILNNVNNMEYQQTTGQLSISFKNMQLKRIKRADRKGHDAVTEEKFCILFQSDFNVGGSELIFQVWTLSLPVVVTVHGNQECNALATVLWDNAFSEPGRIPFQVPESVPWYKLAEQLSMKFEVGTGRGLSNDNIQYLASKIFKGEINEDYSKRLVTWTQFNKEQLPNRNFTFWEWFFAMYKLTVLHLKDQWNDGSILGFVSKVQAQEWLKPRPNGTFLLRFSDSEIGGITIAWIVKGPGEPEVWNLAPFVSKDFAIRSLADRIKDLTNMVYLYPDIPKDQAFSKYYTQTIEQPNHSADGYIHPDLVNVINWNQNSAMINMDNPQTPLITNPQSPYETNSSVLSEPLSVGSIVDTMDMDYLPMLQSNTDYNPEDIENINVNDLLYDMRPSLT